MKITKYNRPVIINGVKNVTVTSETSGSGIEVSGGVSRLKDLDDVALDDPQDGQILTKEGDFWVNTKPVTLTDTLTQETDKAPTSRVVFDQIRLLWNQLGSAGSGGASDIGIYPIQGNGYHPDASAYLDGDVVFDNASGIFLTRLGGGWTPSGAPYNKDDRTPNNAHIFIHGNTLYVPRYLDSFGGYTLVNYADWHEGMDLSDILFLIRRWTGMPSFDPQNWEGPTLADIVEDLREDAEVIYLNGQAIDRLKDYYGDLSHFAPKTVLTSAGSVRGHARTVDAATVRYIFFETVYEVTPSGVTNVSPFPRLRTYVCSTPKDGTWTEWMLLKEDDIPSGVAGMSLEGVGG